MWCTRSRSALGAAAEAAPSWSGCRSPHSRTGTPKLAREPVGEVVRLDQNLSASRSRRFRERLPLEERELKGCLGHDGVDPTHVEARLKATNARAA